MARWHSCNVLEVTPQRRQLWQFEPHNGEVELVKEQARRNSEPLPAKLYSKDWQTLWQRKLNIAWLPVDKIFLRVLQLPAADRNEIRAMVELQLEKVSPLPVGQIVWTLEILPQKVENLQTVIVVIVARDLVEAFLGELEGQGYLADRLEISLLDQLLATPVHEDGVWIYPRVLNENTLLIAWWYGGALRNLGLAHASVSAEGKTSLKDQLTQMAWAGDLEGWLTSPPKWHLVADEETAREWEPVIRDIAEAPVEVRAPVAAPELAGLTAKRAAHAPAGPNLLPQEFATRYQQQFIDRLWMRGLGAVMMVYVIGVVCYFGFLQVLKFRHNRIASQVKELRLTYTNSLQLKARIQVLQDQVNLKFAALDCWQKAVELLPEDAVLTDLSFKRGKTFTLRGTIPSEQQAELTDYSQGLGKARIRDQLLFRKVDFPTYQMKGANTLSWSINAQLRTLEAD